MPLTSKVAQLALEAGHDSPLRNALTPILREARKFTKKEWESYKKDHPGADKSKHTITDGEKGKGEKAKGEKDKGKKAPEEVAKEVAKEVEEKNLKLEVEPALVAEFSGEIPEYHLEIIAGGEGGGITETDLRRAKAIKAQLSRGIEKAADVCKMSPPVCEGNLGVYRESMPQLSADESIKTMMMSDEERIADNGGGDGFSSPSHGWKKVPWDQLTDKEQAGLRKDWSTSRKKGQAAVDAGADPDDDRTVFQQLLDGLAEEGTKIGSQEPPYEKVKVGKLKATQREIKAGKAFGMANSYLSGQYDPRKAPIIISSDNHILDGHHRYSAMVTADPEASMNVIRVDMPMKDFLERSFVQPGVFRADLQDNIVDSDKPLDLSREKGSTWQQPGNDGWYAKNKEGETGGPFKDKDAAKDFASGKGGDKGKKAFGERMQTATKKEYAIAIQNAPHARKRHIDGGKRSMDVEWSDRGTVVARKTMIYTRGKVSQELYMVNPDYLVSRRAHSLREAAIWLAANNIGPLSKALLPIINSSTKTAGGNHHEQGGKIYADTAFLNHVSRVPGVTLKHMGFGEFYAETPKGRVDFDRMRGKDFPGQSSRSHQVYGPGAEWLVQQMERGGHSDRV